MKINPIDERVLIKPLKEEERRIGNIIIPDTAKERPQMGEVVAVVCLQNKWDTFGFSLVEGFGA